VVEKTEDGKEKIVKIQRGSSPAQHIRPIGSDIGQGQVVLKAGDRFEIINGGYEAS